MSVQKDFTVIPTPYLPVFIVPMQFLLVLPPLQGWAAWTALQAVVLMLYFRRISKYARPPTWPFTSRTLRRLAHILHPRVRAGEPPDLDRLLRVLLALRRDNEPMGGLWLAMLMVKPQLLMLILPALLIQRRWRVLAGAAAGCGAVVVASVLLAGPGGMAALVGLWLGYTGQMPTTYPELMMNWRSLMLNLRPAVGVVASSWIAVVGIMVSAAAGILIWLVGEVVTKFWNAGTGTYAMTCVVAWHAHVHLALPLLGTLYARNEPTENHPTG